MADNLLGDILQYWPVLLIGIILIVIVIIVMRRRKPEVIDYHPQPLKKTLKNDLDDKLKFLGKNVKGNCYIGMQRIAIIRRVVRIKGTFALTEFDPKTRRISIKDDKPIIYDLFLLESLSNNFLIRIFTLGLLGRFKMIIKNEKSAILIEGENLYLPEGMDMMLYGKIWTNTSLGIEYLTDISMKRLHEQQQMHIENVADKFVAIEMHQAKTERTLERKVQEKKNLYKEREDAGDSDIDA